MPMSLSFFLLLFSPKQLMDRLQSVQNAAARLIFKACHQDHIQLLLRRLHWFRCQNVFRSGWQCWCIAASTALHLATWPQIFSACHTSMHVDDCALRLHQRQSLHALCILPLATAPFQRLLHWSGTVCQSQSGHRRRCKFSAAH